jgi:L,D-transpeptidase catalytic domain
MYEQRVTRSASIILALSIGAFALPDPAFAQGPQISCASLPEFSAQVAALYGPQQAPFATSEGTGRKHGTDRDMPPQRLDRELLETAYARYRSQHCYLPTGTAPATMVVVDFTKPSSQPRLYAVNMITAIGIDQPIGVAHGIGSDPDDDGVADRFGNQPDSLMSSLGAARGAELYSGINGLSLRLDGLDPSNNLMRARDIVAHSYAPDRRRYFNASLVSVRGRPGSSEGCFVVQPEYRDWLFSVLGNGGFLYAGLSEKTLAIRDPQLVLPVADVKVKGLRPLTPPKKRR